MMIQSDSPLLENFEGLYTYGQPKLGDRQLSKSFTPDITNKIFNHVYNNGKCMCDELSCLI